jgi:hypothetical protein
MDMNSSRSAIMAGSLALAAIFGLGGLANAQSSDQLSDMAYISVARCTGFAEGSHVDAAALKALLTRQEGGRIGMVLDRADQARADAEGQASRATGYNKQSIADELAGPCQKYLKG